MTQGKNNFEGNFRFPINLFIIMVPVTYYVSIEACGNVLLRCHMNLSALLTHEKLDREVNEFFVGLI